MPIGMMIATIALSLTLPMPRQANAHHTPADLVACVGFLAGDALTEDERQRLAFDMSNAADVALLSRRIHQAGSVARVGMRTRRLARMYFHHHNGELADIVRRHHPVLEQAALERPSRVHKLLRSGGL